MRAFSDVCNIVSPSAQAAFLEQRLYQTLPVHRAKPDPVRPKALQGGGRVHPAIRGAGLLCTALPALRGVGRGSLQDVRRGVAASPGLLLLRSIHELPQAARPLLPAHC